jgi:hypothetical protein
MTEETHAPKASTDEAVLQQQYLRALSSFEGIILSQIDIKNKLGDRLNYSIRTGLIILGVIAFSILVLLLTLSAQINRISAVVGDMNSHFASVGDRMNQVRIHMIAMEKQMALLGNMSANTGEMDQEMAAIESQLSVMEQSFNGIRQDVTAVRSTLGPMTLTMDRMNAEVQAMSHDMSRMAQPARSFNKMFPFP